MDQVAAPYERDGFLVVPIDGEFDVGNAADLDRYIINTTDGRVPILDFTSTGYLDSSVLAVLIRRKKALGASLGFVVPPASKVRLIFDVSGLVEVLSVSDSIDEAVKKLRETRLGTS